MLNPIHINILFKNNYFPEPPRQKKFSEKNGTDLHFCESLYGMA